MEQDPTIHVARDSDTAELIMSTVGEAQAQVVAARLEKNYGVGVDIDLPRVPYRETSRPTGPSSPKQQTGGHGQYGHVVISIEPPSAAPVSFADSGAARPRNFIPPSSGVSENLPAGRSPSRSWICA
jgi:elongation factor G